MQYEKHIEKGHILCRAILEVVGGPKKHIEDALKSFIDNLKESDDFEITKEKIEEAKPFEDLFSTFAEVELWVDSLPKVFDFCITAMPSSIEILEPSKFSLQAGDLSNLLNDFQQKIHAVDMSLKQANAKAKLLDKNSSILAENIIALAIKDKPLDIKEIEKDTGIQAEKLKNFLSMMKAQKKIALKDGKYTLVK